MLVEDLGSHDAIRIFNKDRNFARDFRTIVIQLENCVSPEFQHVRVARVRKITQKIGIPHAGRTIKSLGAAHLTKFNCALRDFIPPQSVAFSYSSTEVPPKVIENTMYVIGAMYA